MRRLFGCTVSLLYEDARGEATLNAPIARLTEFWWNARQPDARSLWEKTACDNEPHHSPHAPHSTSRQDGLRVHP